MGEKMSLYQIFEEVLFYVLKENLLVCSIYITTSEFDHNQEKTSYKYFIFPVRERLHIFIQHRFHYFFQSEDSLYKFSPQNIVQIGFQVLISHKNF